MMTSAQYADPYITNLYNQSLNMSGLKRKMKLDLSLSTQLPTPTGASTPTSVIKRARMASSLQTPIYTADILASPDFKNLQTPDLDFAMKNLFPETGLTPITSTAVPIASPAYIIPDYSSNKRVSSDSDEDSMTNDSMTSSTNSTYTSMGTFKQDYTTNAYGVTVKQEQPSHTSATPIDMQSQEKAKLERKRMRNRVAASKCRKRKLEKISKLEEKVNQLKRENGDLASVLDKLRDGVSVLREQVRKHAQAGCQIMVSSAVDQFN